MEKLKVKDGKCENCGKDVKIETGINQLLPGTVLNERYLVGAVIGEGGYAITYIGRDLESDKKVVIKEFFPQDSADRDNTKSDNVILKSEDKADNFDKQRISYLLKAESLSRLPEEKGIINLIDTFELNRTAYTVNEYQEGVNLLQYVEENGPFKPDEIFRLMLPVIEAVKSLHDVNIMHRDINPENIIFLNDGTLKLTDLASSRFITSKKQETNVVFIRGYAPKEQYSRDLTDQGTWTDVYGLCATIYMCITGNDPQDGFDRTKDDLLKKPSELEIEIDGQLEEILMSGLAINREDRIKNMGALQDLVEKALDGRDIHEKEDSDEEDVLIAGTIDEESFTNDLFEDDDAEEIDQIELKKNYVTQAVRKNKTTLIIGIAAAILTIAIIAVVIVAMATAKERTPDSIYTPTGIATPSNTKPTQNTKSTVKPTETSKPTESYNEDNSYDDEDEDSDRNYDDEDRGSDSGSGSGGSNSGNSRSTSSRSGNSGGSGSSGNSGNSGSGTSSGGAENQGGGNEEQGGGNQDQGGNEDQGGGDQGGNEDQGGGEEGGGAGE